MDTIIFKTLKKSRAVTIPQNVMYNEMHEKGELKGKVKAKRRIRYVQDMPTIYYDEQVKISTEEQASPLIINNGVMKIMDDEITLIEFMRKHPDNQANGGFVFKELDIQNDDILDIKNFEITDDAKRYIMKSEDTAIRGVAIWFFGAHYVNKTIPQLQKALRQKIDADIEFAKLVNNYFEEKNTDEKQLVSLALAEQIISVSNGKDIVWGTGGDIIFRGSQPSDVIKDLSIWVKKDEEGRQTLKLITDKLQDVIKETKSKK